LLSLEHSRFRYITQGTLLSCGLPVPAVTINSNRSRSSTRPFVRYNIWQLGNWAIGKLGSGFCKVTSKGVGLPPKGGQGCNKDC